MAEDQRPQQAQAVQFHLKTLLKALTALAVLAAIAGPYFRRQSPQAQLALVTLWSSILVFTVIFLWLSTRQAYLFPPAAGRLRFLLSFVWRPEWNPVIRMFVLVGFVCLVLLWIGTCSYSCTISPKPVNILPLALQGVSIGIFLGATVPIIFHRPAPICENGILFGGELIPWKYLRNPMWLPNHPTVCRINRHDGDLYIKVPTSIRESVYSLLCEKCSS